MESMSVTGSQENELEFDESLFKESNKRTIDKPWAKWTEANKKTLMDHINYHTKCIEFITKCWASGVTDERPPKQPESDLEKLIKKGRKRKGKTPYAEKITGDTTGKKRLSTSNKKGCKETKTDWKNMTPIEFNEYLKTLLRQPSNFNKETIGQQSEMPTDSVDKMGDFLKQKYDIIKDDETA